MKKRVLNRKSLTAVLAVAAALIILTGINGMRLPPSPSVSPDSPTWLAAFDSGFALVDDNNARLLLAGHDLKVYKAVGLKTDASPFETATDITACGDRIYITARAGELDGIYFKSEGVVEYSTSGEYLRTLYSEDYGDDEFVTCAAFLDVKVIDGRVMLLVSREDSVEILDITGGGAVTVLSAPVAERVYGGELYGDCSALLWECVGRYCLMDASGEISPIATSEYIDRVVRKFGIEDVTDSLELDRYAPRLSQFSLKEDADGSPEYFYYTTITSLKRYDFASGEDVCLTSLRLSFGVFAFSLAFYISIAFLAVLVTVKLFTYIRRSGNGAKARTVLVILLLSAGISAFYTYQSFGMVRSVYESRLLTQAKQMKQIIDRDFPGVVSEASRIGTREYTSDGKNRETVDAMLAALTDFVTANGKEDCVYAGVVVANTEDAYDLVFTDSPVDRSNQECTREDLDELVEEFEDSVVFHTTDQGFDYICCLFFLYNEDGSLAGLLSSGITETHLLAVQRSNGLRMLLSLAVLQIVAYIGLKAASSLRGDIEGYRAAKRLNPSASRLPLFCGFAAFLVTAVCQFDSVVLVYAVRSLCSQLSSLQAAKMAAIPMSLYSFGIMGGSALPSVISKRMKEHVSAFMFCILGAASMLLAVYSLGAEDIFLFSAAKCVEGVAIGGAAYSIIFSAPFNCADRDEQKRLINTAQTAAVSAGVFGVFAGGYISEYLSFRSVFAVKGVMCILLAVICLPMLRSPETKAAAPEAKGRGAWGFYLKPRVLLLYLCCVLPINLFNGYRSYLFPIYSQGAGITAVVLSDIYVIARASAFFSSDAMNRLGRRYTPSQIMLSSLTVCAVCLVCFLISPNIWWAVAVLFISNILLRSANTASIFCQSGLCEELGYDAKPVSLCSETVKGVFNSVTSPVLSMFLSLGNTWACAALGGSCMVLLAGYGLIQKKRVTDIAQKNPDGANFL